MNSIINFDPQYSDIAIFPGTVFCEKSVFSEQYF
jgi:hypothetical protein